MLFNSITFAIFFCIFLTLYVLLRSNHRWQNHLILAGSAIFYGWWDWRFLLLMLFTIVVDYTVALLVHSENDVRKRKQLVLLSVVSNLTVLCFFKYFNFFIDSFVSIFSLFAIDIDAKVLNIVLPVGISFYTFQSMSYVIDTYRKKVEPARTVLDYATYVAFFPQLVAGPIERGSHLLPQILKPRTMSYDLICEGCYLIYWGLFKKLFVADNLAKLVNPVFASTNPTPEEILVATYAFAFQIYCDFSAYSDIARGIGKILGVDIMLNFRLPYFATNPSEFWRRWHISLSTWLRDYLYVPLGGNKGSSYATYRNLMITMLLGGLWHGAHANFILWGAYQGLLLVIHRKLAGLTSKKTAVVSVAYTKFALVTKWFVFFHLMCFGWLLFRAESFSQIQYMTLTLFQGVNLIDLLNLSKKLVFYTAPLIIVQIFQAWRSNLNVIFDSPIYIKTPVYLGLFYAMLVFGADGAGEFIYFQF